MDSGALRHRDNRIAPVGRSIEVWDHRPKKVFGVALCPLFTRNSQRKATHGTRTLQKTYVMDSPRDKKPHKGAGKRFLEQKVCIRLRKAGLTSGIIQLLLRKHWSWLPL